MRITLNRRDWLRLGLAGIPWLSSPLGAKTPVLAGKAKSVLLVYTSGGMSQFESWDPKPNAPAEVRGAFGSIATSVPGIRFGELMPRVASLANRMTVIRSMSHDDLDHGSAAYLTLTGQPHARKSSNPLPTPNDFPTQSAILRRLRPAKNLPYTAVHLNGPLLAPQLPSVGQNAGFLGRACEPLILGDVTDELPMLQGLEPRAELPKLRLDSRRSLLNQLQGATALLSNLPATVERDPLNRQAYELLSTPSATRAFDLEDEPERVRDRYGRNRAGQACLLARRLVERGVPWVTVFFNHGIRGQDKSPNDTDEYGWDTHNDIFQSMRDHLMPRFDLGFSALLEDMEQRGLLETTLVVCLGEFGRAPRVALEPRFDGATPGRKHWGMCYSIAMAGAGVTRGATYGSSDKIGAYPSLNPVTPPDVMATLFHALGIDPAGHFQDLANRPVPITSGKPLLGLFA
ncbi:DUF1501 domain-containing protein [Zavarzinella formosa]|uniref:DUF1501 domain-containing protein n=1 Tax=Zavarzinella formosa TaxID=360055 RepID=UPI000593DA3E|nr:DUF1501 domain-containing protein [Zavarzinella formosa]